jgi:esterase
MKLFYHDIGAGEPLVILHGLFGISDNWMTIGKSLSTRFRVIIPDLRNHGRSPHSDAMNYPAMYDDLLELLEELSIDQIHLMGHSMGGKLAMHFSVAYPEMVKKLVVVDISPKTTRARQIHFKMLQAMKSVDFDLMTQRSAIDTMLQATIPSPILRLFVLKNLVRVSPGRLAWRINLEAIEMHMDDIMEGVPADVTFNQPTLFIRGGASDYIPDEDLPLIKQIFTEFQLITIPAAGHWVHAEQPVPFLKALKDFVM